MGYRIQYGQTMTREFISEHNWGTRKKWRTTIFVTGLLVLLLLLSEFGSSLRDRLLPGNTSVTEEALDGFVENMSNGMQFRDAITAFCGEILDAAKAEH